MLLNRRCRSARLGNSIKMLRQHEPHLITALIITIVFLSSCCSAQAANDEQQQVSATNQYQFDKLTSSILGEKPKLIPIVVSDSGYSENSSVNILCTVSQGHHETLTFDWFKDGQLLTGSLDSNNFQQTNHQPQIDKNPDHSLLRISRVLLTNSGRYTCSVKNQFGSDSSSANLIVNGN